MKILFQGEIIIDLWYIECLVTKNICIEQNVIGPDRFLIHKHIFLYILGLVTLPDTSPVASELMVLVQAICKPLK